VEINKQALIASEAAAYRADKTVSVFKEALQSVRETKKSTDLHRTGLGHVHACERHCIAPLICYSSLNPKKR
jgi:hypothetical protein